eukprot:8520319-Pyramimonas_sp.AAC.1
MLMMMLLLMMMMMMIPAAEGDRSSQLLLPLGPGRFRLALRRQRPVSCARRARADSPECPEQSSASAEASG